MTNRRKPRMSRAYRIEFLRSPAWFARRARWFRDEQRFGMPLGCAACGIPATKDELELHHLAYQGVVRTDAGWQAWEPHSDLVPLHPYCHELLHRLIDRDTVLSRHRTRRAASLFALHRLRAKLATIGEPP